MVGINTDNNKTMGRSALIAALLVVALVLWMLSGQLGSKEQAPETDSSTETTKPISAMKVQTELVRAESITREIIVQGELEPAKVISMRAETGGNVERLRYEKGQQINSGQVLATLAIENRNAALAVANASMAQAKNEYDAAKKLQVKGLQSKLSLEAAGAKLEAARAEVSAAQMEIDNTNIIAPIDAQIEDIHVEVGDFIERGTPIATLVDNSAVLVTGRIPQQHIASISVGQSANAILVGGETITGKVSYLASMADTTTRSFHIEVLIEFPPEGTPTGTSAQINIPVETLMAHRVSPAVLALSDDGALGVKAVDSDNKVVFHKADVVRTESNGAWLTGLPNELNLITMGQGFVGTGETVEPVAAEAADEIAK